MVDHSKVELLACPFCGENEIVQTEVWSGFHGKWVNTQECKCCGAAAPVEVWSQRYSSSPQTEQQPLFYINPFVIDELEGKRKPSPGGLTWSRTACGHWTFAVYAAPIAQTRPAEWHRVVERLIANVEILDRRPRPICRDCADCNGVCDSGLDCDIRALVEEARAMLAAPIAQTAPQPEQSGLVEALADAAQSLETISNGAGKDEFMQDMADVRGYARSRAGVARAALSAQGGEV